MNNNTPSVDLKDAMLDNFMPYTAYMILHRALPMIDGLKPSQRRVLYTMYKTGALPNKPYIKSNTIGGDVMKIHPHGSTYGTLVRMTEGQQAFGVPFSDSKGNLGKLYSRDGREAADRYTEARLNNIALELFKGVNLNAVPMVDTYDNQSKEPSVLPTPFPLILTSGVSGMAVGMATDIPPFNFHEVIEYTRKVLKGEDTLITDTIKSPDFPFENDIVYNKEKMEEILSTGRGTFKLRAPYEIKDNTIYFKHVPYTTKYEVVIDKIAEVARKGQLKEITDVNDLNGMKSTGISIEARKNTNMQLLVEKLYRLTPLESTFSVNLNLVIDNTPQVLGVKQVIEEWIKFRKQTVINMSAQQLKDNNLKLTRLKGLESIMNHLDQVIDLIRKTKSNEVVSQLQAVFKLTEEQAEYVSNMQLRQLSLDNIQNRLQEIEALVKRIQYLELMINDDNVLTEFIDKDLARLNKEYSYPRKTQLVDESKVEKVAKKLSKKAEEKQDYNVRIFITEEMYIKKIPLVSIRGKAANRLKDGDSIIIDKESTNNSELLVFTNKRNVYKKRFNELDDHKLSDLGDYIPTLFSFETGEEPLFAIPITDFKETILFGFANGKVAKVNSQAYQTKTNRERLTNAYGNGELIFVHLYVEEDKIKSVTTDGYAIVRDIADWGVKASRNTAGNNFMNINEGEKIKHYSIAKESDEHYLVQSAARGKRIK